MTVKVGSKRTELEKSEAAIAVGPLKKLSGAMDALRAGEPGRPIEAIEQITEGLYAQAKCPESSEDFDFLGIGALRASRPLSVRR